MLWLIAAISAYLILSIVFTIDKYLLGGSLPNPKIYTLFVGILGILTLLLIPFVNFEIPSLSQIFLSFFAGALYMLGLFWFYKGVKAFEVSRIVPAIGALVPLFSILLVYVFSLGKEILSLSETLSFFLLIAGSVLITLEKEKFLTLQSLKISTISAFLLSLSFVLAKFVFLKQPFWSGFILIKIGGVLGGLIFLFSKEVRTILFQAQNILPKKSAGIFLFNQGMGALANILQNWAIALSPLVYVSLINALQGIQYAFLLIFTVFISLKFPKILKEEIKSQILIQKIFAIFLIIIGLAILSQS
jgi:drug/metabolite transporter (DMT)-like permease